MRSTQILPDESPSMIEIFERHQPIQAIAESSIDRAQAMESVYRGKDHLGARNPVIHTFVFSYLSAPDGFQVPGYWTSLMLYDRDG